MASTLSRLFRFVKATEAEPVENFTTEALAGAIGSEPEPFLALLLAHGLASPRATILTAETQILLAGFGKRRLDLGIELGPLGKERPVWIEVKVGAPESGNQLDAYASYIARLPEETRPHLVVLASKPLREDVPWISWKQVYEAIMAGSVSSTTRRRPRHG